LASARTAGAAIARPRPKARPATAPAKTRAPSKKPATAPAKSRARATRSRAGSRSGIAWIVIGGLLLAGVVFVNLLVLQLNLRLDSATRLQTSLKAQNAALQGQLAAALDSHRIQSLAHDQDGLVEADPATTRYIELGK
jgi:hypothetical protein